MPQFGVTGSIGNVYEFTTVNGSTTNVIQLAGSAEIFPRSIYNTYYFTGNNYSSIQAEYPSIMNFDTVTRSSIFGITPNRIAPATNATSSYTTYDDFNVSGSVLSIRGSNNHHIRLTQNLANYLGQIFYVTKETNNSQQIKLELTSGTIHGSSSLASSSPYCSIMLINVGGSGGWSIMSKIGDWS